MKRIGDVKLRLAKGPVPHYKEIKELSKSLIQILEHEFGTKEVIHRFSNPLWFNSFACFVGFEWNYSGMTTVTLRAIKEALNEIDTGLYAVGGKGEEARVTRQIDILEVRDKIKKELKKASILSAKVDNNLLQDGHSLYFHFVLFDNNGNYTIINQKMSIELKTVRRFHWLESKDFINEDRDSIGTKTQVLDLSGSKNKETRDSIIDLVHEKTPDTLKKYIIRLSKETSNTILKYMHSENESFMKVYAQLPYYLKIPSRLYINALELAKTVENFEDLLFVKGLGPGLLRALAYASHLIYGTELSWEDPIKYTFAHGTKAGRPYYVQRKLMLEEADLLKNAVEEAKVGKYWKLRALRKIKELTSL